MAVEAALFPMLKDCTVTFTDGSATPIVYTFRVSQDGIEETVKRQREDVRAEDTDGTTVAVRKSGVVAQHPQVKFTNLRIHSVSLGSTAISATAGSLVAIVRGTGPSGWTNTDSARCPDHITGTLLISQPDIGGAKGESRSYTKARIVTANITEVTRPDGRYIPELVFECIDEPTITVNT